MKKDIKVAAIQAGVPKNTTEGEAQIKRLVAEALKEPVDMVGLPEDYLATWAEIRNGYDPLPFLSSVAKENNIYLFGATAIKDQAGLHNRGFMFDKKGNLIAHHDKVVLTPLEEKGDIIAGKTLEIFETEFGKMAILVCKDAFHRYAA